MDDWTRPASGGTCGLLQNGCPATACSAPETGLPQKPFCKVKVSPCIQRNINDFDDTQTVLADTITAGTTTGAATVLGIISGVTAASDAALWKLVNQDGKLIGEQAAVDQGSTNVLRTSDWMYCRPKCVCADSWSWENNRGAISGCNTKTYSGCPASPACSGTAPKITKATNIFVGTRAGDIAGTSNPWCRLSAETEKGCTVGSDVLADNSAIDQALGIGVQREGWMYCDVAPPPPPPSDPPPPPPSPPPSPPSPPPLPSTEQVLIELVANEELSTFTLARQEKIQKAIAAAATTTSVVIDWRAVHLQITAGSVIILATIDVPGSVTVASVEAGLAASFTSTAAATALLGITVTSTPAVRKASPSPPPSPAPPLSCNDVCNWSVLKKEPLVSQNKMCIKYQPTSINAPLNPPSVTGEFDLYHCKLAEPGDICPGDYQMCYGNSYFVAPASATCPENVCGTCANQDKCGKEASCLKKKQKGKCHKRKLQKKCGRTCAAERIQRDVEKERKRQEKAARKAAKQAAKLAAQQQG